MPFLKRGGRSRASSYTALGVIVFSFLLKSRIFYCKKLFIKSFRQEKYKNRLSYHSYDDRLTELGVSDQLRREAKKTKVLSHEGFRTHYTTEILFEFVCHMHAHCWIKMDMDPPMTGWTQIQKEHDALVPLLSRKEEKDITTFNDDSHTRGTFSLVVRD